MKPIFILRFKIRVILFVGYILFAIPRCPMNKTKFIAMNVTGTLLQCGELAHHSSLDK